MHIGLSAVYGPQLPCCANAEAAAASAAGTGNACDSNCVDTNAQAAQQQAYIDRIAAALQDLQVAEYQRQQTPAPGSQWFSGVSNGAVILVGVGLGALLLFRGPK